MEKKKLKTTFQNISLLLVSIILILLLAEIFIRAAGYKKKYQLDEKKQLTWQYETKKTHNSMGYRDYEYQVEKLKGVFRIYVLGDSFTYGQGIKMAETYPKVLERILKDKYPNRYFEVINASFLGLDTERELGRLKKEGLRLSPDMVILGFYLNDPSHDSGVTQWKEEDKKEKIKILFNNKTLLKISHLYWFLKIRADWVFNKRVYVRTFLKLYEKDSKTWKDFESSFSGISELTRERNIPLLVVIFPSLYQLNDNYPFFKAHSMVKKLSEEKGVEALDLFNCYKGISDKSLWVKTSMPANTHPNAKAHQMAAIEIFRKIEKDPYFRITSYLNSN